MDWSQLGELNRGISEWHKPILALSQTKRASSRSLPAHYLYRRVLHVCRPNHPGYLVTPISCFHITLRRTQAPHSKHIGLQLNWLAQKGMRVFACTYQKTVGKVNGINSWKLLNSLLSSGKQCSTWKNNQHTNAKKSNSQWKKLVLNTRRNIHIIWCSSQNTRLLF